MKSTWTLLSTLGVTLAIALSMLPIRAGAGDYVVYSVYKELDLGNSGEPPQKDYYVNLGRAQGVREGSLLTVKRKVATYDLLSEKLYKEMLFPIARVKVIHVESNAAIARLEKLLPADKTPATTPHAIMIGDVVSLSE